MSVATLPTITEAIDQSPLSLRQWVIFGSCALVVLLDGWDTQSIGIVAPLLRSDLELDQTQLGSVFSISQLGAAIAALLFGSLADRFGRKPLTLVAVAIVAVFTFLTALSHGYSQLLLVRFAAGLGLGGAIPCILALGSEFAPQRLRGFVVTTIFAAFPLGAALGGLVTAWLVGLADWRMVFYVGGVLPALVGLAFLALVPESLQFLATRGRTARIVLTLRQLKLEADPADGRGLTDLPLAERAPIRRLFSGGLAAATLLLASAYFFSFATTKVIVVWFPSILQKAGLSLTVAAFAQASYNLGAAGGMALSGRLVDRFGPGAILAPALVISSVCVVLLGAFVNIAVLVCLLSGLAGLSLGIGAAGAHALAVQIYAPPIRSSGLGLGLASSRFGQVLSPLIVGIALSAGATPTAICMTVAILPLLAAAAATPLALGWSRAPVLSVHR